MFGLSLKEQLSKALINSYENHIDSYKRSISEIVYNYEEGEEQQKQFKYSMVSYMDECANDFFNSFRVISPDIYNKILLIIGSPEICGFDCLEDLGYMPAGMVYAIAFYAFKNKQANSADCIELNHIQHKILDRAIKELATEE